MQLADYVDGARGRGAITADRAKRWWSTIDAAEASGDFNGGITAFVVVGTVDGEE